MRIALIGCMVMNREISYLISKSNNIIRPWWFRQGLHDTPDILHKKLQETINEIEFENERLYKTLRFETIVLAYGLCSNAVIGLKSNSLPVIIPRCDDCISLFLGSAERYRKLFHQLNGVYWYNIGWIEQAFTPSKENYEFLRNEYIDKYGEDNADYLLQCTNNWMTNYKHCAYITCPLQERSNYEQHVRKTAKDFGWNFTKIDGNMNYLDALINGPWDEHRFLSCPPYSKVEADFSEKKIISTPLKEN